MTAEILATFRFLFIYPVMLVFGIAWSVLLWRRWKHLHNVGDGLAMALGAAIAIWGACGLSALYVAQIVLKGTYTLLTGITFTLGAIIVCAVLVVGVVWMFILGWQSNGQVEGNDDDRETEGD